MARASKRAPTKPSKPASATARAVNHGLILVVAVAGGLFLLRRSNPNSGWLAHPAQPTPCTMTVVDGSALTREELVSLLAASTAPVLVRNATSGWRHHN